MCDSNGGGPEPLASTPKAVMTITITGDGQFNVTAPADEVMALYMLARARMVVEDQIRARAHSMIARPNGVKIPPQIRGMR